MSSMKNSFLAPAAAIIGMLPAALLAHPGHNHEDEHQASVAAIQVGLNPFLIALTKTPDSTATLRPRKKIEVYEYEVGVEIGSRAFHGAYKGDMDYCMSIAEGMMENLDRRFLHGAGVKHRLGTVVVRHDKDKDPLRDDILNFAEGSLYAFRDYWNRNSREVGDTHDLAVYHVYSPPSGRAWVDSVGGSNRYAISCGRGATSWANGTISHEFGHSWKLAHNNISGLFYEARPRVDYGTDQSGGRNYFISIMNGKGEHNVSRLSTEEAEVVMSAKKAKLSFGDKAKDLGPVRPFGAYDRVSAKGDAPVTIDVIANDYDSNNDILDVQLLDTVSNQGGTISLSAGTGPGGRNEIIYTPPTSIKGEDFFHYRVFDTTGLSDWGCVYVK